MKFTLVGRGVVWREARADTRSKTSIFTRLVAVVSALLLAGAALAAAPASAHARTASGSAVALMSLRPVTAVGGPGPSPAGEGPVKSPPPGAAAPEAAAAAADEPRFFHAVTRLDGYTDGAFGSFPVYKPRVVDTDSHSLAELDVEAPSGAGSTSDIVEVGWTVDRRLNGDDSPHLFVFHWVAGVGIGYNGQGFVPQPGAAEKPGDPLLPGSVHKFMIKHYQGNWWIGDNTWFGYYPDSLWPHLDPQGNVDGSTFTKGFRVQWFGEVATHAPRPCSQMGTGYFSSDYGGAAHIDGIGEFNGPVVQLHVFSDAPDYYTASANGARGIRYGGPGACVAPPPVAVPNLVGLSTAEARNTITLAGLKVGVVSSVIQPDCNDTVISQTPAFGAPGGIARGGLVDFEYAVARAGSGCPTTE